MPATPGAQAGGNLAQHRITGVVPERIVHALEGVEIEQQQRHQLAIATATADGLTQPLLEHAAVGQAGERVVIGQMSDAGVGALALGDVDVDADQADDPGLAMYRRQNGLDLARVRPGAVGRLVVQRLAVQHPLIRLRPQPGHFRGHIALVRGLPDMAAPMRPAGGVVHDVAAGRVADPEVERQALDRRAQPGLAGLQPLFRAAPLADV